jgi:hypothetical protein
MELFKQTNHYTHSSPSQPDPPRPPPNWTHSDSTESASKSRGAVGVGVAVPYRSEILGRALGARRRIVGSGLGLGGIGRQSMQR